MSVRVDSTRQNKKTRGVYNRVPRGVNMSKHLTDRAAFDEYIRLLNAIRGDNGAILNQDSHASLRTVQR